MINNPNELSFEEISTMDMFTHCHVCALREGCSAYNDEFPRKQCPLEPIIYRTHRQNLVKKKKVDPVMYDSEIHEIAMLHVKLWRRTRYEAMVGTQQADLEGSSKVAASISRLITQKEKALGTDRGRAGSNVKDIGAKRGDLTSAFIPIEKVKKGKAKMKGSKEIMEAANQIKTDATRRRKKENIKFSDLEFGEFGLDIEPIEKKEPEPPVAEDYKPPVRE